jgi:putative MFS transporter
MQTIETKQHTGSLLNAAVIVAALGYFVDIYDLLLFGIVRTGSLTSLGLTGDANRDAGEFLISTQMWGMLVGGIFWGVLGDKKGRLSVLFGSILTYSVANIANGMVSSIEAYAFWRFLAGVGLAGELGAGITLVSETLPKEKRGYGTMIVAAVGLTGAIVANLVYKIFGDWRLCYYAGGGLGLLLLFLRVSVVESHMFKHTATTTVSKGNFFALFTDKDRFGTYLRCIFIGIPLWFIIGVLITFAPEFAIKIGVINAQSIVAGDAISWCYGGLVAGDLMSGMLSQILKSRKKVMYIFLVLNFVMVLVYVNLGPISPTVFYMMCALMGLTVGYWVIFVTIAAEQYGTNMRATVATTVPNFVRGSLPLIIIFYKWLRNNVFNNDILQASLVVAVVLTVIALLALWKMKETFGKDLDYTEEV